jgi:lipoprotein NlpI
MQNIILLFIVGSALLSSCASQFQTSSSTSQMSNLLLAEPAPMNPKSQLAIARYSHILTSAELDDEQRAQVHLQRGTYYDSLGLSGLAQYDYNQAIQLKSDLARAYNSIGVHYTQQMNFIQAYESFDATLDIDPSLDFAFLNRGIALYYGGRPQLASDDLDTFYNKNKADPLRAVWRYLAQSDIDKAAAMASLANIRPELSDENWATYIVDLFLGEVTENQVLGALIQGVTSQQQLTYRLCEAYFYLGKYHVEQGNSGIASNYFKLSLSTNVFEYIEHRYARLELGRLREKSAAINDLEPSQVQ